MPRWLVTGGSGFLGRHILAEWRRGQSEADRLLMIGRQPPPSGFPAGFERVDLCDREALSAAVGRFPPDFVIHAAGVTPPAESRSLELGNVQATDALVEVLERSGRPVRLVALGSAAELGAVPPERLPVGEDFAPRPLGDYGRTKLAATERVIGARSPVAGIVARVFNPIGPGQPKTQAFGRLCASLASPGPGTVRLTVANLDARRDFIDARDVARAVIGLAERGRAGEVYHVGTGQSRSIGDGLDVLIRQSGRNVEVDSHTAAEGLTDSRADPGKLIGQTGWSPAYSWEQSLGDQWNAAIRAD